MTDDTRRPMSPLAQLLFEQALATNKALYGSDTKGTAMTSVRYKLEIDDLLARPIRISTLEFDAHVSCVLYRQHETDEPDLDSVDVRTIYLHAKGFADQLIELDRVQLETRHKSLYELLLKEIDALAIRTAKATPIEDWEREEFDPI